MMNCKEASVLMSLRHDRRLGAGERLGLSMHLLLCPRCRRFARQIALIQRIVAAQKENDDALATQSRLSQAARERIARALQAGAQATR
jgi:predicted anti-sigma-YlaC factor YlaD